MMLRIIASVAALALFAGSAQAQVSVRGYYRPDGTYVQPHTRSSPNGTTADNYGSAYRAPAAPAYTPPRPSTPPCEGYACYGQPSTETGRPRTVQVDGYYRSDGTYVAPHYRSAPR